MPTIRGWAALGVALALLVLWFGFGEELLLAVGAFLLLAVFAAVMIVRSGAPKVAFHRRVAPLQVHDGERAIVEVSLTSARRLSQAVVEDVVHGLGAARLLERVRAGGYEPALTGENLASGQQTAKQAMDHWMASKGHRDNILERGFRDIGVGVSVLESDGELKILWVQFFGRRRP